MTQMQLELNKLDLAERERLDRKAHYERQDFASITKSVSDALKAPSEIFKNFLNPFKFF